MAFLCDPTFSRFGTVSACDRRTDKRTDRQTHDDRKYRASIASRGKNTKQHVHIINHSSKIGVRHIHRLLPWFMTVGCVAVSWSILSCRDQSAPSRPLKPLVGCLASRTWWRLTSCRSTVFPTEQSTGLIRRLVFFAARLYASTVYVVVVCPSVCLSVCFPVISRHCTKMAKRRITQTTPYDKITHCLYLSDAEDIGDSPTGSPPTGAPNRGGVRSIGDFRPIFRCLKMVQDGHIATMEGCRWITDDLAILYVNLVNFGPCSNSGV